MALSLPPISPPKALFLHRRRRGGREEERNRPGPRPRRRRPLPRRPGSRAWPRLPPIWTARSAVSPPLAASSRARRSSPACAGSGCACRGSTTVGGAPRGGLFPRWRRRESRLRLDVPSIDVTSPRKGGGSPGGASPVERHRRDPSGPRPPRHAQREIDRDGHDRWSTSAAPGGEPHRIRDRRRGLRLWLPVRLQ